MALFHSPYALKHACTEKGGTFLMTEKKLFHSTLVPALDALIGDPDILLPSKDTKLKADFLVIPAQYISRIRAFRDEISNRGEAAAKILGIFSRILEDIHYSGKDSYTCANGMEIVFIPESHLTFPAGSDCKSSMANTLATVEYIKEEKNDDIAILTGDNSAISLALLNHIDVARVSPEIYTGRRKIAMPEEAYDTWFRKGYIPLSMFEGLLPDEKPLQTNEFIEFTFDDALRSTYTPNVYYSEVIGRLEPAFDTTVGDYCIQQLHYIDDLPHYIRPRTAGKPCFVKHLWLQPKKSRLSSAHQYLAPAKPSSLLPSASISRPTRKDRVMNVSLSARATPNSAKILAFCLALKEKKP